MSGEKCMKIRQETKITLEWEMEQLHQYSKSFLYIKGQLDTE